VEINQFEESGKLIRRRKELGHEGWERPIRAKNVERSMVQMDQ
jgi:hypothetical protein